ncbi:hypothetical protein L3X38_009517 [Prunus dulcis]|uniref:Uncharacterized protein n=1 Tax=Prunus dulcis TaxID=3755 RepID=A0AAD4WGG1_PRUDU|nr:hypothetical protein L3X38_009517 [Prunus dulcis]
MKGHLLLQPHEVIDFSKPRNKKTHNNAKAETPETVLAGKLVGISGDKAIKKIVQSIERLGPNQKIDETQKGFGEFRIWDSLEGLGQNEKWDETHKDFVEFGIVGCLEERRGSANAPSIIPIALDCDCDSFAAWEQKQVLNLSMPTICLAEEYGGELQEPATLSFFMVTPPTHQLAP